MNGDKVIFRVFDKMDDGSEVCLMLIFDVVYGIVDFDFFGTFFEVLGNWNASSAVINVVVIYSICCFVK